MMKLCSATMTLAAVAVISTPSFSADRATAPTAIQFLPGQQIVACPKDKATSEPAAVCSGNVLVGGGETLSGYTYFVRSGTTLPSGVFLMPLTGVITAQSAEPALPPAGAKRSIYLTVTDATGRTANGVVSFVVQKTTGVCGCPVFQVYPTGPLPPANPKQPYSVTLGVVGPPSNQVLRPNYSWSTAKGTVLPAGLVLDQSRGVLRGTPHESTAGENYDICVEIEETHIKQHAIAGCYSLHVNGS